MRICLALLTLSFSLAHAQHVDLREFTYRDGVMTTEEGGVIKDEDIRIQARSIEYTRKGGVNRIRAHGDLLVQYKGRVFVGERLEYDFETKTGTIYEGRTGLANWYIGGERIELHPDGSYEVSGAFVTTCENRDSSWDIHADSIRVNKEGLIEAKSMRFRLFKTPIVWLPSFKINLFKFEEPVFDYAVKWDSGMGPRFSVRYQFYSWRDFAMYGRLEYRVGTGWGGAFETDYAPKEFNTRFVTRSYLATDRLEPAPNADLRYRLQGAFHHESEDEKTRTVVTWDKYSDVRMQSDFKCDDFEVATAKKTIFTLRHREDPYIAWFKLRPRVNPFESIKQDLPTGFLAVEPLQIANTGIYSISQVKASYLDFVYSNQLVAKLPSYESGRVEVREKLYRPFHLGPATFTPYLGGDGIFYSNSPSSDAKWFGILSYGAKVDARATRNYGHLKHQIEPYLEYTGLSKPTVSPDNHYIFSIQDGLDKINQIQAGVRNLFYQRKEHTFIASVYANAFFADFAIPQVVPYGYLDLNWKLRSLHLDWYNAWNFRDHTVQFSNARLKWTINENVAFTLEGRYRSKFDWRKADHENFILDVTRSQSELLLSPLSDRRVTILTNLYVRLTPFWECSLTSHHGFYRKTESPYNEIKFDLLTWLNSALKLRLSYKYTDYTKPNFPHHFGANIEFVK